MTSPPAADQRVALQRITAAALAALAKLWPGLGGDADAVRDALRALMPSLADEYGTAAGTLATDVYGLLRAAAAPTQPYTPTLAPAATVDELNRIVGWAVEPLYSPDPKPDLALYRVSGGLQKVVADEYRDTIQAAALDDPAAEGWQREARAGGCPFCVMLAARGAVYSEQTVDFGAHRDCHCLAVPAFLGEPKPVREYTPTSRTITPADRARVRRWIAQHQ